MFSRLKLYIITCAFFCCSSLSVIAQESEGKAKPLYDHAIEAIENKNFEQAAILLQQSLQQDSTYIYSYLTLFQVYLDLKQMQSAIDIFEKGMNKDSGAFFPYTVKYANAYASIGKYQKAYQILNPLRNNAPSYLKQKVADFLKIFDYAIAHPEDAEIKVSNAGDSINSSAAEYFPTVTVQDSLLLFMRRNDLTREDFYFSTITPNGFSKAAPLSDTLNFANKKGSPSLSADLQTLYYAADYAERGYGRYDIYKVTRTKTGWSMPKNLGQNINSDFWESAPSISPDGQSLYFCSNIPGGYGGIDIYVAHKNEKGGWDEAENLGPIINTAGDEQTPFIHADNRTLYFASNGLPGYGGSDLFMSRKKMDGTWTKPINLGYPINTIDNEGSIAVASDGIQGYIASDRVDSRGGLDIYKVTLSKNTRANKTNYLKGIIAEAGSHKKLSGIVRLVDPTDSNNYMEVNVDTTGSFVLALPVFDSLGIQVNSPNHEYASLLISEDSLSKIAGSSIVFNLNPIQKQFSSNFKNVFFETNAAQLKNNSNVELNALFNYLQSTPNASISIEGHTDNTGNPASNLLLSTKRADAIAQYLIQKGILATRITTKGFGATKPIADNATPAGRAQNRRTSFTITLH
jgi:outer membrane protein OmpA-like peptidoglycan-associated protein/tetratricopeptide (TPR) repeat protein